jgi:methyl-accepting chemotaxis protein
MYIVLAVVGVVMLIMLGYGYYASHRMTTVYGPLVDAAVEMQLNVTASQLYLEELLTGESDEDIDFVYSHLDDAEWYINAMLVGGSNEENTFHALDDAEMRQTLVHLQEDLAGLRNLTEQRYAAIETAGVGSILDRQYDELFDEFLDETDVIENQFQDVINRDMRTYQITQVILAGICVVAFIFVGTVLRRYEARNRKSFAAVRASNESLAAETAMRKHVEEALKTAVAEYRVFAQQISTGDLTARLELNHSGDVEGEAGENLYQLGHNLNLMIDGLTNLARKVLETATAVSAAADEIQASTIQSAEGTQQVAASIQQIAAGTNQQTESVMQATTIIDQLSKSIEGVAKGAQEQAVAIGQSVELTSAISATTQQVAASAQAGAEDASVAARTARDGANTVEKTIQGMANIKAKVGLTAQKVREMGERSGHIGTIVETIDGIAAQTNLLALNATIEAARAGEHGKGFAVVADEVRNLAEKATEATQEVARLIKDVQQTVQDAIQAMDEGASEVEVGVVQAGESRLALDEILKTVEAVNKQMSEISTAAQSMEASANEMVGAMDTVSAIVEENTASTEEMAAGSDEVSRSFQSIAAIAEENSAATEEVSASVEEVTAQAEEVTACPDLAGRR